MPKKKKIDKETIYAILALVGIFAISYSLINIKGSSANKEKIDRSKCPYKIEGKFTANLTIKYIDSPYCIWCWFEEPVLKNLVAEKGHSFKLERYDIDYCAALLTKYKFSGTPSFVFSLDDESKEYAHTGFIPEENFNKIICEVTGNCA